MGSLGTMLCSRVLYSSKLLFGMEIFYVASPYME